VDVAAIDRLQAGDGTVVGGDQHTLAVPHARDPRREATLQVLDRDCNHAQNPSEFRSDIWPQNEACPTALIALRQRPGTVRNVRSWLSAVLQSRVGRLASRERRRTTVESRGPTPSEHAPSAVDAAATAELHRRIAGALVEMPEPYPLGRSWAE